MARIEDNNQGQEDSNDLVVQAEAGGSVSVPDSAFVTGSQIIRDVLMARQLQSRIISALIPRPLLIPLKASP